MLIPGQRAFGSLLGFYNQLALSKEKPGKGPSNKKTKKGVNLITLPLNQSIAIFFFKKTKFFFFFFFPQTSFKLMSIRKLLVAGLASLSALTSI